MSHYIPDNSQMIQVCDAFAANDLFQHRVSLFYWPHTLELSLKASEFKHKPQALTHTVFEQPKHRKKC
ncbi:hypothetical protein D3C85_1816060 [compost metagenome]